MLLSCKHDPVFTHRKSLGCSHPTVGRRGVTPIKSKTDRQSQWLSAGPLRLGVYVESKTEPGGELGLEMKIYWTSEIWQIIANVAPCLLGV